VRSTSYSPRAAVRSATISSCSSSRFVARHLQAEGRLADALGAAEEEELALAQPVADPLVERVEAGPDRAQAREGAGLDPVVETARDAEEGAGLDRPVEAGGAPLVGSADRRPNDRPGHRHQARRQRTRLGLRRARFALRQRPAGEVRRSLHQRYSRRAAICRSPARVRGGVEQLHMRAHSTGEPGRPRERFSGSVR
jgi:hypothetical protein